MLVSKYTCTLFRPADFFVYDFIIELLVPSGIPETKYSTAELTLMGILFV